MSAAERKQKDSAMAAYMKAHPGQFPDSEMRPHSGVGSDARKMALSMGRSINDRPSSWYKGVLGGVVLHRMGFVLPNSFSQFVGD